MFVLNKERILEVAKDLREKSENSSDELFELLGGKELYQVFDKLTVESIMKNIVSSGKIHDLCVDTDGFEILEGLLDRRIVGDMGKFYNIKPEYILRLTEDEQLKMASSLSENNEDLENLLMCLWKNGITTIACGGKRKDAYLEIALNVADVQNLARIQAIVEKKENKIALSKYEDIFTIAIYGDRDELYSDLLDEFSAKGDESKSLFLEALLEATESDKEVALEGKSAGTLTNDEAVALLEDNSTVYMEEIKTLQNENDTLTARLADLSNSFENLNTKYLDLQGRYLRVRSFITNRIGKIPLLGRAVLGMLEKDLGQNQLEDEGR